MRTHRSYSWLRAGEVVTKDGSLEDRILVNCCAGPMGAGSGQCRGINPIPRVWNPEKIDLHAIKGLLEKVEQ